MIKYFLYIIIIAVSYNFFSSCASQSTPTGGPKDSIPPILVNAFPPNQSLNFKEQNIVLEFNERIKTNKIKEQLIITPLYESEYENTIKKNTIRITFEEPFNDSTTYTLNFREAIQDITEGNPTEDNKFTFSTTTYIDSMSIQGYVKELLTYDTLENVVVGLYNAKDTITIFNGSPYYFTEVDEDGKYLIDNIKNGKYLLYAFIDANKNLKLESNKEAYGFVKDTLLLDSAMFSKNLDLVNLDLTEFKMNTALSSGKYFEINLNKFIVDYEIIPIDNNHEFYTIKSKENKSIRFFNTFTGQDSIQVSFTATDSINTVVTDTLYVKFIESKRKTDDLLIQSIPKDKSAIEPVFNIELTFNKPIISYSTDSIYIQYDTTKILQISDSTFQWSKHKNQLSFDITFDKSLIDTVEAQKKRMAAVLTDSLLNEPQEVNEKKQMNKKDREEKPKLNQGLQVYLGTGSFISADNDTSTSIGFNYKLINPSSYGIQDVIIESEYNSFTFQLLKENFEMVREVSNEKSFSLKNLEPGKYKIRVLIDANNDGKWSPGNMKERIEPEPVYIYPDILVIRADWQTSLNLSF